MKQFIKKPPSLAPLFAFLLLMAPATNLGMAAPTMHEEKIPDHTSSLKDLPDKVQYLIKMLKKARLSNGSTKFYGINALLISGPDGNGKSAYAHIIAEHTGAKLIVLPGTYFTSKDHNCGDRLRKVYHEITDIAEQQKQCVILLIDNADAITDKLFQCALWCMLDRVRDNPRIVVIMTVKKHLALDVFDTRLSSRMSSLEINNPTYEERLVLEQNAWNKATHNTPLDQKELAELAEESQGLSRKEVQTCMDLAVSTAQKKGEVLQSEDLIYQIHRVQLQKTLQKVKLFIKKNFRPAITFTLTAITTYCIIKLGKKLPSLLQKQFHKIRNTHVL